MKGNFVRDVQRNYSKSHFYMEKCSGDSIISKIRINNFKTMSYIYTWTSIYIILDCLDSISCFSILLIKDQGRPT